MNKEARARKRTRERWFRVRKAEVNYARQLREVAKQVGAIIDGFAPNGVITNITQLTHTLHRYGELLFPWAQAVAQSMVAEVDTRDFKAWTEHSKEMGIALRRELAKAPTGELLRGFLNEQVSLITSLPREAAERVHKLTLEGLTTAGRASEISEQILRSGEVTRARANTIARTEVSRTATGLVEARALYVGSEGYFWRSAGDVDVRPLHKKLNGKFFRWDAPPIAGEHGERAHPGGIYNCRCYPEVVIPDEV